MVAVGIAGDECIAGNAAAYTGDSPDDMLDFSDRDVAALGMVLHWFS
jgi:hypothetical protein